MNEEQIENGIEDVVSDTPAATKQKTTKKKITYTRVPMSDVTHSSAPEPTVEPTTEPVVETPVEATPAEATQMVNTTRPEPRATPTQHVNDNYPDAVTLTQSGGDAYIGGSVSPNSTVRASLRPMNQYAGDPFWLESNDRFSPVGDWTVKMPILNNDVKLSTTDIDKAAYQIATMYEGVPAEKFFGYEYTPLEDYHETWWSAGWGDMERNLANILANTRSSVVGLVSDEEAAKPKEQREQENREATDWGYGFNYLRRRAQEYLDYVNQLEPLPRTRTGEIVGAFGSAVPSALPMIASIPSGAVGGWLLGGAGSAVMSAVETLDTRDTVLQSGGTVDEAQRAQWKHLGVIGATEVASAVLGQYATRSLVRAAINRGASRALTAFAGAAGEVALAAPIDATTEVLQDKFGTIMAGQAGYESLFGWSREDWNTFYGTLLFAALTGGAGAVEGVNEYNKVADVTDNYLALTAQLKGQLLATAEKNGVKVTPEMSQKLDEIAMQIWQDPYKTIDDDMRSISQEFFDKMKDIDPKVLEQARSIVDVNRGETPESFQKVFKDFDKRVKSQPWFNDLSETEQQVVLGQMRGMAYVGAFFFGQSPSEIRIPTFEWADDLGNAGGQYQMPSQMENEERVNAELQEKRIKLLEMDLKALIDKKGPEFLNSEENQKAMQVLYEYLNKVIETGDTTWPSTKNENPKVQEIARGLITDSSVVDTFNKLADVTNELLQIRRARANGGRIISLPESARQVGTKQSYRPAVGKYDTTYGNPILANLNTLLHEFSHANDWNLNDKQIADLTDFADWYTSAIAEVFGKKFGGDVNAVVKGKKEDWFGFVKREMDYESPKNVTEARAQAVGRLLRKAKDYIGLTGKPAQYIQAVNALLQGADETFPMPNGLSEYMTAMKEFVKDNSTVIKRIRDKVPAERMNAAIKAYMGGEKEINWQGVTPRTLEEFAKAATYPLDADALQYALQAIGDTDITDFVDEALGDWEAAWDKVDERVKGKTESEQITDVRENEIDGGLDPEVITEGDIEDWEESQEMVQDALGFETIEKVVDDINEGHKKGPSEFQKKISKKFNGKTLQQSMDDFLAAMKEHKYVSTGTMLDFVRGIPSFLSAIGGEKLVHQFDLVKRYDDFANIAARFNEGLVQKLVGLFDGSRRKYEDYIRRAGVQKYQIQYLNPATKEKETRTVSKRELMSAVLYNEQPDSTKRIAMTVDDAEVRSHLDDFDIKFARTIRDVLAEDYRRIKEGMKGAQKVPENYFPIMDSYAQEKGATTIVNDIGRKHTDEPIGLVDVMKVMGGYMSRVAGTQSGYFAAVRRLNSILNYNARNEMTQEMLPEDLAMNAALDKLSTQIGQELRDRMGAYNYERFRDNIRDIIEHKNDDELKDSFASRIARNSMTKLIYGKVKQLAINVGNAFSFLGYEYNSYQSYLFGMLKALAHPVRSWRLAMENETLRNRRNLYRYNEYMEKNLSANSDNLVTYLANWATRKDIKSLEALTDLMIHIGTWTRRVFAEPLREGDFLGNVIGYAASYDAAKRALGSDEAARRSLAEFVNTRQSTSNQAVKGLMVRRANRAGFWGNIFAFTGEPTQKWGSVAQDVNRMLSGDLSVEAGTRDIVAQTLTQLAYVAVQSGLFMAAIMPLFGGKMSDDDWDKVYNNVYKELVGVLAGVGGPLTNAIVQPTLNQIIFDYDVNGMSLPGLAWLSSDTDYIKKGEFDKAFYDLLDVAGITSGLANAMSEASGAVRYSNAKNRKERNAGLWMMEGRSEGMANRLSNIKKKKKKR